MPLTCGTTLIAAAVRMTGHEPADTKMLYLASLAVAGMSDTPAHIGWVIYTATRRASLFVTHCKAYTPDSCDSTPHDCSDGPKRRTTLPSSWKASRVNISPVAIAALAAAISEVASSSPDAIHLSRYSDVRMIRSCFTITYPLAELVAGLP
jgi:hypothetical protein